MGCAVAEWCEEGGFNLGALCWFRTSIQLLGWEGSMPPFGDSWGGKLNRPLLYSAALLHSIR